MTERTIGREKDSLCVGQVVLQRLPETLAKHNGGIVLPADRRGAFQRGAPLVDGRLDRSDPAEVDQANGLFGPDHESGQVLFGLERVALTWPAGVLEEKKIDEDGVGLQGCFYLSRT